MMISVSHGYVGFSGDVTKPRAFAQLWYLGPRQSAQSAGGDDKEQKDKDKEKEQNKAKEDLLKQNQELSKIVGTLLKQHYKIDPTDYYLTITDPGRVNWGHNYDIPWV